MKEAIGRFFLKDTVVRFIATFTLVAMMFIFAGTASFVLTSGIDDDYYRPTTSQCVENIQTDRPFLWIGDSVTTRTEYCQVVKVP